MMKKSIAKRDVVKSFEDYQKKYFPNKEKNIFSKKGIDPKILGHKLATESLRLIKNLLSE